jgi:N6-L-threonylcarbamoyladenine synthase
MNQRAANVKPLREEGNDKSSGALILGIETSCDETAASVVRADRTILSNRIFSQYEEHRAFGGVVPEIAARAHLEHLETVVRDALEEAGIWFPDLSAIAVTAGPGLIGGVIVGVMAAQGYASVHRLPLLPVNHLEGHALSVRLTETVEFPFLLALLSGGHCQMLLVEGVGQYRRLGGTRDDALGEAFDKTAKMMGLGYPGGPAVERLAAQGDATRFPLPRPLFGKAGCEFSFSGLKTAVRLTLEGLAKRGAVSMQDKADLAASFQQAVCDVLEDRFRHALEMMRARHPGIAVPSLVLAGGVAANRMIRRSVEAFAAHERARLIAPPIPLCTDNAAMIAWAGMERFILGWRHEGIIEPRARWSLEDSCYPAVVSAQTDSQ